MWSDLIVFANPHIEIDVQPVDWTIHLLAKRVTLELVRHGLVEAFADTGGRMCDHPPASVLRTLVKAFFTHESHQETQKHMPV